MLFIQTIYDHIWIFSAEINPSIKTADKSVSRETE